MFYTKNDKQDFIDKMIQYEQGELEENEIIDLFQYLYDNSMIEHFQGHYQRVFKFLWEHGKIKARTN